MNEEKETIILAFESSCDETSVALVKNGAEVLAQSTATQIKSHQRFGGVVPEVASRHHIEQIIGCLDDVFQESGLDYTDLSAVAVTYGPGLVGALLVGISAAKAVAFAHDLPLIPVNHMAGHIYAARYAAPLQFPSLALLVSGGHTELVYLPKENCYQIIGETRDDACGEAFDKIGRVLGINYPAGKEIDNLAHLGSDTFHFPRAMDKDNNYDFSFSGLKSAFINTVHHADQINEHLSKPDLASSFQQSVIDVLTDKTVRALHHYSAKQLILAGGVAANNGLRARLKQEFEHFPDIQLIEAPLKYCGDNAAMIGAAAYVAYKHGVRADMSLNAEPSLEFPWLEQ